MKVNRFICAALVLIVFAVSAPAQQWKYFALNGAAAGMDVLDVESTQRCIRAGTCHEANPLMGQSRTQQYAVSMGLVGLSAWMSYRSMRRGEMWWIAPVVLIGVHGAAAGLNLRF